MVGSDVGALSGGADGSADVRSRSADNCGICGLCPTHCHCNKPVAWSGMFRQCNDCAGWPANVLASFLSANEPSLSSDDVIEFAGGIGTLYRLTLDGPESALPILAQFHNSTVRLSPELARRLARWLIHFADRANAGSRPVDTAEESANIK